MRLMENIHDSTIFWRQVKQVCANRRQDCHIPENVWFNHFREVFQFVNPVDTSVIEELTLESSEEELSYLNSDITEEEIAAAISKLKKGRAAGLDEILAEMLKSSTRGIVHLVCRFFNVVFSKGLV